MTQKRTLSNRNTELKPELQGNMATPRTRANITRGRGKGTPPVRQEPTAGAEQLGTAETQESATWRL